MIVFFNPWSTPSAKKPLPMSLLALASMVDGEFDWTLVDGNLEADPVARIVDVARSRTLTAIAVTVMPGPQLDHAVPACRLLKARLPGVPIVWGGYFPSQHAEVCLRSDLVDYCIVGQGERAFLALVRTLRDGGALDDVQGLARRDGAEVRTTPKAPLTPLDELPEWPHHRLPMDRYLHRHYLGDRVAAHHSSFGCPFACSFCAVVGIANRRWMAESPARTERALRRLHDAYGADAVQFHDMDFFVSEARAVEIAERMRPLGMRWWALGRVDELMRYRDASWRTLRDSGLTMVFCGAESGSADVLKRMNKGGTAAPSATLELARRMRDFGVVPEFSFVLGNPPEPEADARETIAFVRRVKRVNPAAEIILYTYTPVPLDGAMYDEATRLGFRFPDTLEEWTSDAWKTFALRRDPKTPWLDGRVRRQVRDFESVLNAFHPTVTDSRLTGTRRLLLKSASAVRYAAGAYAWPIELRLLHRVFQYQRPETTGF